MSNLTLIYNGKIFSKKNSKQIIKNPRTGKPTIISNKNVRMMEKEMTRQFKEQAAEQEWTTPKGRCQVTIEIMEESNIRHDLDNQLTSILDGLTAAEILADDSVKYISHLEATYLGVDRDNPHAEINIWEEE